MTKICVVAENKAKVKAFKVDRDSKADLLVFVVEKTLKQRAMCFGIWRKRTIKPLQPLRG